MLVIERSGAVIEIALAREQVRNALDLATTEELLEALREAAKDGEARAVLLRGEGPGFCSGSDVREMSRADVKHRLFVAERKAVLMRNLAELPLPVVAAVHGFALGGGFMLAIGCDVVVTARDAVWRLPEVGLGFFPPWGIQALLTRVGAARAKWLTWGIETVSGAEAVSMGLAEMAVSPEAVLAQARNTAQKLAALPAAAAQSTKNFYAQQLPLEQVDAMARAVYRQNCDDSAAEVTFDSYRR